MDLFGGAITAAIPGQLLDASEMREVPDNQEVFVGPFQSVELALIIELLEPVDKELTVEALAFHVEEMHRVSGTTKEQLGQPVQIMTMQIGKHEYSERIDVIKTGNAYTMLLCGLFRLPEYETEVLLSCTLQSKDQTPLPADTEAQKQLLRNIVESFTVVDPNLFKKEVSAMDLKETPHTLP